MHADEVSRFDNVVEVGYLAPGVVGRSRPMKELFEVVRLAAESPAAVLIEGESGTGKELVARALHLMGSRQEAPFLGINCGALPESLLEGELFGYRAGAFTGAVRDKVGLLEAAREGTIFLDEIAEISTAMQVKLLRALQEGEIIRLGEVAPRRIKARVVAATNRSLRGEVAAGRFRADLYYRLNVIPLWVPPLRQRPEDIPLLANYMLRRWHERYGRRVPRLDEGTMESLSGYSWPGNVRELENELERVLTFAGGRTEIPAELLSLRIRLPGEEAQTEVECLQGRLDELEVELIREALERSGGNKSRAAIQLGVSRQGLHKKLVRLGLEDFRAGRRTAGRAEA